MRHRATLAHAGRWSLLKASAIEKDAAVEAVARTLLQRYGVVFRKLVERENVPTWRQLVSVYRRLEARGEIRGGRFVEGFTGEHFALPEAVASMRRARNDEDMQLISLCGCDPLNLVGCVLPGDRVAALPATRMVFRDGLLLAVREAGQTRLELELEPELATRVRTLLVKPERLHTGDDGNDDERAEADSVGA
jgi:ATP-dependent Lhr-like helicase